jgi:uncharacterized delta-60 repeat protein
MKPVLFFLAIVLLPVFVLAQPGANDPTFNTFDDGTYRTGGGFNNGPVWCTAIQPDGKIIVGGDFESYNGTARNRIARLNTDGSVDHTFNPGTGFDYTVSSISLQADGKIIVGGDFTAFNGTAITRLARLHADGSLDNTLNPGNVFNNNVITTAVQADGKIVVGGMFSFSSNGVGYGGIARMNPDGSPDLTFNSGAGSNQAEVICVAIQADGKIIVGGRFTTFNSTSRNSIVRLNTNGHVDSTFNIGTGFTYWVYAVSVQPDGKIIAGGNFTSFNGTTKKSIARLHTDGSLDTTFNLGGGFVGHVWTTIVLPDGKIMAGGTLSSYNPSPVNRMLRLNADGSIDTSFNSMVEDDLSNTVFSSAVQADGKILIGGDFSFPFNGTSIHFLARLNTDGSPDVEFNPVPGFNKVINATAIQTDQKILVGGNFKAFNGMERTRIVRLDPDGSLDLSFNSGTGFDGDVLTILLQPDGKIIVGGDFITYNGTARNRIARLNADGTLDATFNIGTGCNEQVSSISIQPDGKFIVGGKFTHFNGTYRNRIVRLNANGSIDLTFNPGTGFNNNYVYSTAIQTDGKILAGGDFISFNGTPRNRIVRLNANGSLDASFNIGRGFDQDVLLMFIQADGKIVVGGYFTTYNGATNNHITRLNTDGSRDASFNPGTGANGSVRSLAVQTDGKFVIGGGFTEINGTPRNYITRLHTDGSLDTLFNPGSGYNGIVLSTTIQADGKIIAGGNFTSFNGIIRNRIGRIFIACPTILPAVSVTPVSCSGGSNGEINLTPSGGTAPYTFLWSDGPATEDRAALTGGTYSVTISDANGCTTTASETLTIPVSAISATTVVTHVSCFSGSDGAIDLTADGGTLPYTFDWDGGNTTEDITALAAGTYAVTIGDANGCLTIHTTVTQPDSALYATTSVTNVSCFDASNGAIDLTPGGGISPYTFDWGSGVVTEDRTGLPAAIYAVSITDANGCSTTISPSVTTPAPLANSFFATACYTYTWNTQTYTASGVYTQVLTAANGCDSTLTLHLTINNATTGTMTETVCDAFTLNDQTYTTSGTYVQILTNAAGCDSTLTLNLTILHATTSTMTETVCDAFTLNDQTYTASGTYVQNLTNAAGCDSTLILNLTILHATTSTMTETACDVFTLNDQTYSASGTYIQNLTNVAGCDSTLTLYLTISHPTTSTHMETVCGAFILNDQTYTTSGIYIQNLTNVAGCDSTLTLNLTVIHATTSAMTQTVCDAFTWNDQTYTASGIYVQNLTNAAGCDSTLTLNLTINNTPHMTIVDNNDASITASAADAYQWIDCSTGNAIAGATTPTFTVSINGTYAVVGTSNNSCADTSVCITINTIVFAEQGTLDIILAPNPTQDLISIQFEGLNANLTIRDSQGKPLASQNIIPGEQISLLNYASGIYLLEFATTEGIVTKRVVKD